MAVLKCKMCGGDLNVTEDSNVVKCEFCDTTQTVLMPDNEKKTNLYNRANRLRFANEFDKAAGVFESLVAEFPEEAEAYWGLCLCKYGIEYVDDPATGKKIPTCHRTSYESIFDDSNFELALEYADPVAKSIYREEAKSIDRIQKGILEIASKEEPFDIFICYKETDEKGERTIDSVLAQDIYDKLTEKGYKVFFSRITLEDKLGQEYEPYIFSALNSAKIMLVIGTKYEYFDAVWVKNEWSRFLDLMKNDKDKTLIPCYRDIDAYDMPREFKNLQGQDMSKLGYEQDLVRGVSKILGNKKGEPQTNLNTTQTPNMGALTRRGQIYLEDGEFKAAYNCFDKALNDNPEDSEAYLGKFMSSMEKENIQELKKLSIESLNDFKDFERAIRFADSAMKQKLIEIQDCIETNFKKKKELEILTEKGKIYNSAEAIIEKEPNKISSYEEARELFISLQDFQDSKEKVIYCNNRINKLHEEEKNRYNCAQKLIACGQLHTAAMTTHGYMLYAGPNMYELPKTINIKNISEITAGGMCTVGLKYNGSIIATGIIKEITDALLSWKNIVKVDVGGIVTTKNKFFTHIIGLRADGSVVATGNNRYHQCNVSGWKDIVSISTNAGHTVGLMSDGKVVAVGNDGSKQCSGVAEWTNIVAVAAGGDHTVGLKNDGTVVAAGDNDYNQCNVENWKGIIAIAAGLEHTVGLREDGTVVAIGDNHCGQCNISNWEDVVAILAGSFHTVGLRRDGRLLASGLNRDGQCNVSSWKLFDDFDNIELELRETREKKFNELQQEKILIEKEISNTGGFFGSSKRKNLQQRLSEIEAELNDFF